MTPFQPSPLERFFAWLPFVASAALVALGLHLAMRSPLWAVALAVGAVLLSAPSYLQRRRLRRLFWSGDVEGVLESWEEMLERVPHRETIAPLVRATAFAAHGFTERARASLERARRGPAWDAALEQRLLIETMLDAFDGDRDRAVESAAALGRLPLPASPLLRSRVADLRAAMGAFARAFCHQTERGDIATLSRAARRKPLMLWALRYAAAIAYIDRGRPQAAARLLSGAPEWPSDSVFSAYHEEIREQARLQERPHSE